MSDDILLIIWLVDKMAAYQYSTNLIPHNIGTKTFRTENAVEWRLDSTSTTQFFCQIGVISFFVTFLRGLKPPKYLDMSSYVNEFCQNLAIVFFALKL